MDFRVDDDAIDVEEKGFPGDIIAGSIPGDSNAERGGGF